jgi:ADP-heptose:LPS heptosyltransferase/cell division protein FtsW (lipid II flippase)
MSAERLSTRLGRFEVFALAAFVFALPILEAPKNLLFAAYLVLWVLNSARTDWGGRWRSSDSVFCAWILSGFLVAPFAALPGPVWREALDLPRMGLVAWAASRRPYRQRELTGILCAGVMGAMVGLAFAYWRWLPQGGGARYLELHSVGHVNHTAIYLTTLLGPLVAIAVSHGSAARPLGRMVRLASALAAVVIGVAVLHTESRIALAVALLVTLGAVAANSVRPSRALMSALVVGAISTLAILSHSEVLRKHNRNAANHNVLAYRAEIWARAWVAAREVPVFGVGLGNFRQISDERLQHWLAARGQPFSKDAYLGSSHAHSLYLNTLAERGALGSLFVMALLGWWVLWLFRVARQRTSAVSREVAWTASACALVVVLGIGVFNTTLHHEHGSLAVLMLGLGVAAFRRRASQAPTAILVIRDDNIGDLICTTPALQALKARWPRATIDVVASPYNRAAVDGLAFLGTVWAFEKAKHTDSGAGRHLLRRRQFSLLMQMRARKYDLLVCARPFRARQRVMSVLVRADKVVAFGSRWDPTIDCAVHPPEAHHVEQVFALLRPLGLSGPPPKLVVASPGRVRRPASAALGLHLSARRPRQRWPVDHHVTLIRRALAETDLRILIFWAPGTPDRSAHPGDDELAQEVLREVASDRVSAVPTLDLSALIYGMAECELFLCSDGGAMHVAAALEIPQVCLFGDSPPSRWHPWQAPHRVLQSTTGDVRDIRVDSVWSALLELHGMRRSSHTQATDRATSTGIGQV